VPLPRLLKWTLYLLVLDAFAALYLTQVLGWPEFAVILLTCAGSWWAEEIRARIASYRRLWDILTGVFVVFVALDLAVLAESFMVGVIHLLLFLLVYKLYNIRTHGDILDLFVLTFLLLLGSSTLTASFGFLLVFCFYLILGIWGSILYHLKRETETALPEQSRDLLGATDLITPGFLLSSLAVGLASLFLTLLIFFVIPRVGRTFLPLRAQFGTLTTGFTDRVDLGAYGTIQNDATVVMRVSFPDGPRSPDRVGGLRWRGMAFDRFDGRAWSLSDPIRVPVRRARQGDYPVAPLRPGGPILVSEVYLEPIGTEVIFGPPRVVEVYGQLPGLAEDTSGGLSLPSPPPARLRYLVVSQPEPLREAGLRRPVRLTEYPPEVRAAYLQLPEVSPRIRALAKRLTADAATPYDAVRAVEGYLATNLRYSLDLRQESGLDPLDEFLFSRKAGNCEYFAASLVVLLRLSGVPARVVNGFQRGEWNELGQYFIVRQRDAHSWVEVFFPGVGWASFDPTPRASFEAQVFGESGWLGKSLDTLRMRWNRYVIEYSLVDQAAVALGLRRHSLAFRRITGQRLEWWSFQIGRSLRRLWRTYGYALATAVALLVVVGMLLRRVGVGALASPRLAWTRSRRTAVAFYEHMTRLLIRRGHPRPPTTTTREFLETLAARPTLYEPAKELTLLYERIRFGGEPLTAADRRRAAQLLQQLARAPR
jgi:transglutaminase-like putative cysteine protease